MVIYTCFTNIIIATTITVGWPGAFIPIMTYETDSVLVDTLLPVNGFISYMLMNVRMSLSPL